MRGAGDRYGNASKPMAIEHKHTSRRVMTELKGQRGRSQRENSTGRSPQRHFKITNLLRLAATKGRHFFETECLVKRDGVPHFAECVEPGSPITDAPRFLQRVR